MGALLIVSFYTAALRRKDRTPFHIVVDEFQTFGASTFADMLSGIRKFGVSLTLAHQYLDQLGDDLQAALLGTVGSILAFKVGARDAEVLASELGVKASDFTLLEPHTALMMTGDRHVDLKMPRLTAKRYPSARRRIVNRNRNELARSRGDVEPIVARLFDLAG